MTGRRSPVLWTALFGAASLVVAWLATGLGSQQGELVFSPGWVAALWSGDDAALRFRVLVVLRGPRVIAALVVGACLSVAGQVLQGVTRNPLADPYLLGISGGAGLLVVLLHAFDALVNLAGWWLVPVVGFAGAQAAAFAVLLLARGVGGRTTVLGLVLGGVVINAFCAAVMSFVLARFDPFHLRVTTLWLAGGIGMVDGYQLALVTATLVATWIYLRSRAHHLNAMALSGVGAEAVGVDADRLLVRAAGLSSLLTGLAVSLAGLLGYVGLMIPHMVRILVGGDFRATLPVSAAAGALLLVTADLAARLAFAPEELPVGVLTAILGCPVLLVLLRAQIRGAGRGGAG